MSDCSIKKTDPNSHKQTNKKEKKMETLNYKLEKEKNPFKVYKLHGR